MALNQSCFRRSTAVALVLACGAGAPAFAADATYRVVARSGQFAPGSGFFSSFGTPVISAEGRVAFKGTVIGILANRGVWSEGVAGMNNLELVIRKNDEIPGAGGTFVDSILPSSGIVMNRHGDLAFNVPITGAQAAFGGNAILAHDANGVRRIALPGQLVPLPCGGIGCQRWLTDISITLFAFNAVGQVAFGAAIDGTGVNSDNDNLLLVSDGVNTEVAIREGDAPPMTFGVVHTNVIISSRPHLNDNGELLVRNYLADLNDNIYWSLWRGQAGAMTLVAAQNWLAPVGGSFSGTFIGLGEAAFNNDGHAAFVQTVEDNMGDERDGLWLNSNAPTLAVCFEGMPAPMGLTYRRPESYSASMTPSGELAYFALIDGPGVNASNDGVLIRRLPNGAETIVARERDQAPGLPNGVVYANLALTGQEILDDGRIVFHSVLDGPGINNDNHEALWMTRDGAPPALLLRTGQEMTIGGQVKIVDGFALTLGSGSESGTRSGVSQLGQTAIRVVFTDATEAIVVATPESTCPGDTNNDGVVNFADLNAVLAAYGHLGDVVDADLDLDGDVDFTDLNTVLANLGTQCQP